MIKFLSAIATVVAAPFRILATLIEIILGSLVLAVVAIVAAWYLQWISDERIVQEAHKVFARVEVLIGKVASREDHRLRQETPQYDWQDRVIPPGTAYPQPPTNLQQQPPQQGH